MRDLFTEFSESINYLISAITKIKPLLALLWSGITYVLFPTETYLIAACALVGTMVLDIITKYYALQKPYNSILEAIKAKVIRSSSFFEGTKKKLISLLVLMILCGLSVRIIPSEGVANLLGTVIYSIMFLREAQSCVENLIDAGHDDISWLLAFLKRKEKDLLNKRDK